MINYIGRISDNVMRSNALLRYLKEKDRVSIDGGTSMRYSFKKSFNSSGLNFKGNDLLDVSEQDNFDYIDYTRVGYNISVVYTDEEMDQNSGSSQAINLIKAKISNAETDLLNLINWDLWGIARSATVASTLVNAAVPIHSIPYFMSATPAVGTMGDVVPKNRSDFSMLQNKAIVGSAAWGDYTTRIGRKDFNRLYTQLLRSRMPDERPDLALCGITALNALKAENIAVERDSTLKFEESKSVGSVDLRINNVDIYMDELCNATLTDPFNPVPATTALHLYMITTKYMELVISKNYNFKSIPAMRPYDRPSFVQHLRVFLQLCCENPTRQGVISAITVA